MLLSDAILGDLTVGEFAERTVEWLSLASADAVKTRKRHVTDAGRAVGLRLPRGAYLFEGAVLHDDGAVVVAVRRQPEPAVVVELDDSPDLAAVVARAVALGHGFGNHHVPVEVDGRRVRAPLQTTRELMRRFLDELEREGATVRFETCKLGCRRPLLGVGAGAHDAERGHPRGG